MSTLQKSAFEHCKVFSWRKDAEPSVQEVGQGKRPQFLASTCRLKAAMKVLEKDQGFREIERIVEGEARVHGWLRALFHAFPELRPMYPFRL